MKKSIIFILAICFSIVSCKKIIDSAASLSKEDISAKDLVEVSINNDYSISVPDYMKEMKSLNDDASFQYANIYKETYTIVIDEDKQEFIDAFKEIGIYNDSLTVIENYSEYQVNSFQESLNSDEVKELDFKLKNLTAKQFELNGIIDGINANYLIGFVESDAKMYMLMSWTVDDRYKKYKNTFQLIQNSFKLKN
ncbi:hypothetical protein [Polaribacter sp. Hel_I_88]|uniref:hypothetical protein n=1 Tax=Polaribacter sp. Hel_I_88 TaxID=1250006 RepID=UPI00047E1EAA|nr:hypothetical protein [Polaribacter sp. Hel_I_88]